MTNSLINLPFATVPLTFATAPFTLVTLLGTLYLKLRLLPVLLICTISQLHVPLYILCSEDMRSSLCVSTLNTVCNLRTLLSTYLLTRISYLATTFRHKPHTARSLNGAAGLWVQLLCILCVHPQQQPK